MTSVLGPWFSGSAAAEYVAVAPTSPEADATCVSGPSYSPEQRNTHHAKKQLSKSSYSNDDFDGSYKSTTQSSRTWNDTAYDVTQWTTSAASVVAATIVTTTKQLSTQLNSTSINGLSDPSTPYKKNFPARQTQDNTAKTFGRGIDRDYLQGSPYHPDVGQRTFFGYLGDLTTRFTAPKLQPAKAKWIE